jgi:aspartate/methionine/tyrosine aminotransferase
LSTVKRLQQFGETVFTGITELARVHGAVDLGQGYPNFDGPEFVKDAAIEAIRAGHNQYARMYGEPVLNEAIARRFQLDTDITVDPDAEITVTSGCTEALASACLGLLEAGDEVIVFEPFYDAYVVDTVLANGVPRFVTLRPPDFRLDPEALGQAITDRTRAIIVNTPHNPSGRVFDREELQAIADLCVEHDLIAISDEVYEHMVYEGEHISLATLPGMWERTVTCSSLGKTFSLTGWKIGWAIAPAPLTDALRAAHQFVTYAISTPLQYGAAAALGAGEHYYDELLVAYRERRDVLVAGLSAVGFRLLEPQGAYFVYADHTPFGFDDDVAFVEHLIREVGVAAIPPSAFYHDPTDGADFVRFSFCKDIRTLEAALERLGALRL